MNTIEHGEGNSRYMSAYKSKSYLRKELLNPIRMVLLAILLVVNWVVGLVLAVSLISYLLMTHSIFILTDEHLTIEYPYRRVKCEYEWGGIEKCMVCRYGGTGYGSTPYMDVYSQGKRRRWLFSSKFNDQEFDAFYTHFKERLGERVYLNLS